MAFLAPGDPMVFRGPFALDLGAQPLKGPIDSSSGPQLAPGAHASKEPRWLKIWSPVSLQGDPAGTWGVLLWP